MDDPGVPPAAPVAVQDEVSSEERRHARGLALGTAFNASGAAVGQIAEVITVAILLRELGAQAYGLVVLAQALAQWPNVLESGVGYAVIRLVAQRGETGRTPELLFGAVSAYLGLALLTLVAGIAVSHILLVDLVDMSRVLAADAPWAFDLMVVGAAIRVVAGFGRRTLAGADRWPALRASELVRDGAALLGVVVLVGFGSGGVRSAAVVFLVAELLAGSVIGVLLLGPTAPVVVATRDAAVFRTLWGDVRPVLGVTLVGMLWSRIDAVVVAVGLGASEVAVYGVVQKAFGLFQASLETIFMGLMPAAAVAGGRLREKYVQALTGRALRYAATLVWPMAVTGAVFGSRIVLAWIHRDFGPYRAAWYVAMALVIVMTPNVLASVVVTGANRLNQILRPLVATTILNVVVGVALVGPLGVEAVFLGSFLGAVLLAIPYLRSVVEIVGGSIGSILRQAARPMVLVAVLSAVLAAINAVAEDDLLIVAGVALAFLAYGAAAIRWVVPLSELRRIVART